MKSNRPVDRLLGLCALLAPAPLPLNDVLEWPILALYLLATSLFLLRVRQPEASRLPRWAMNVLGLAYVPVLLLDMRMIVARGQIVQTVVHLAMFAVVVKLFALHNRRDQWQTFGAIFFLFLASVGTSVHLTVVVYLLVFAALSLALLMRLAMSQVLESYGAVEETLEKTPVAGFVAVALAVAVVLATPLFFLFPRMNAPYVGIQGTGTGTRIFSTGFTDEVSLDTIGLQRDNPEVALRLRYDGPPPAGEIRLKGGAFDYYDEGRWQAADRRMIGLTVGEDGAFVLSTEAPRGFLDVWLQPLPSQALLLPAEAVRVAVTTPILAWDDGGAVFLPRRPSGVLSYRVDVAARPVQNAKAPGERSLGERGDRGFEPTLGLNDVSERVRDLAAQAAGRGTARERAERLQRYLIDNYTFSLEFLGRTRGAPIERFLFETRQGHCELFASSMVLMLRSQGIPARLVTGFLGAEYNSLTEYYIVRQSNAHAWVEAYLGEENGWVTLDPTPPSGLPSAGTGPITLDVIRQVWDYMQFRWDRYVLTYGFEDQASAIFGLRRLYRTLRSWFAGEDEAAKPGFFDQAGVDEAPVAEVQATAPRGLPAWLFPAALLLVALLVYLARGFAGALTATRAYEQLRRALRREGVEVTDATGPAELASRARRFLPAAGAAATKVVDLYVAESFGERALDPGQRRELVAALAQARRSLRGAGRRARATAKRKTGRVPARSSKGPDAGPPAKPGQDTRGRSPAAARERR